MKSVADIMSRNVKTLGRNDAVSAVGDLMKVERVRHIPILDEHGKLAGIVSQRDLFLSGLVRALGFGTSATEKVLDSLFVKEVMTTDVLTTTPNTPLQEAAALMRDRKVGCLPVIDGDALVGILTEGDFVAAAASS
jgi:CBS domain-containing protein